MRERALAWIASRRPWHFALAALALASPALFLPLALDDLWLRANLVRTPRLAPLLRPPWDLFSFYTEPEATRALRDLGVAPWWTDELVRLRFFRPLSSATHWLDYALFDGNVVVQHAQGVMLYALVVALAARLYGELLESRAAAGLAGALFVVAPGHAMTLAWVSNRNALVAAALALGAVLAHLAAMRAARRGAAVGPTLFALALLGGEAAVSALAFVIAFELHLARDALTARASRLAPFVVVLAAWQLAYRALGFGAHRSGVYLDPGAAPGQFLAELPRRAAILAGHLLGALPADLYVMAPEGARPAVLFAFVIALALGSAALTSIVRELRAARALATAMALALVPACATFPSGRLVLLASVASSALVALAVAGGLVAAAQARHRAVALVLLTLHGALALPAFAAGLALVKRLDDAVAALSTSLPDAPAGERRCAVVVHGSMLANGYLGVDRDARGLASPAGLLVLAPNTRRVVVAQTAGGALDVRFPDGLYGSSYLTLLTRDRAHPMDVGHAVEHPCGTVLVRETTADGVPSRVTFEPHGPAPLYLVSEKGRLARLSLPPEGVERAFDAQGLLP